jgi:hypothetical protein
MERSNAIQHEQKALISHEAWPEKLQDDPRWRLAQRVVSGSHFARSPLLTRFLLYVVAETIEGREEEITEHQIGMQVFDRRPGYSTIEDNIVRNYARQLRRRLAEFFAAGGQSEKLRIEIPLGGYVPVFHSVDEHRPDAEIVERLPVPAIVGAEGADTADTQSADAPRQQWRRWLLGSTVAVVYSAVLIFVTWVEAVRVSAPHPRPPEATHALWTALFDGQVNTFVVPADAGFNLLEDLSHRPLQLADYIKGDYLGLPLAGVDEHSADDLRSQHFTSFVDFQTVASLARLPEYNPQRTFLRFPRDLTI